jgi:small-conductance mechanosensitive channel
MDIQEILRYELLGNTALRWIEALGYAVAVVAALYIARAVLVSRVAAFAKRTATRWDDLIVHAMSKTRFFLMAVFGATLAAQLLDMPDGAALVVRAASSVAILLQAGIWAHAGLTFWLENFGDPKQRDGSTVTVVNSLGFLGKLVLWSVVVLFALDNVGIKVTALIAGLGVGGIAIALAVQSILGDLFASLSIVLDKPFVVGDFIIVGDFLGVVEHIGIKTTRVRSLSGEQIVFSNNDLLSSRLRNYGRLRERRVVFTLGVTYQTPRARLQEIPGMIRKAIEEQDKTRFDRSHFKAYGAFSLDFETVYYVLGADYNLYMDIQQAINLRIHEMFEEAGIEFAFPTQTIFVERGAED